MTEESGEKARKAFLLEVAEKIRKARSIKQAAEILGAAIELKLETTVSLPSPKRIKLGMEKLGLSQKTQELTISPEMMQRIADL